MAVLPRYQRIGINDRQPQQIDFANKREESRLGATISQQLDRMSSFAFEKAGELAVTRGEERVREEGAIPTLKAITEAGGPTNIEERSAVSAANRIAVIEIESLAKQDMQNLSRDADRNNMSMSAFNESMSSIRDGYSASMADVDPVAAGVLSARLADSSLTYEGRYSDIVFTKAKKAAAERVSQIITTDSDEIIFSATQPGVRESDLLILGEKFLQSQIDLGIKEKTAKNVVDQTLKKAVRQNRLYVFNNASDINQKEALLEVYNESPLPGHSYEANFSFNKTLKSRLNSEIKSEQISTVDDLNTAMFRLAATGEVNGYNINEELIDDLFPGDEAESLKEMWVDAQEDVSNRGALRNMDPSRVDEITSDLEKEVLTASDPERAKKRLDNWSNFVASRNDAINKDAGLYLAQTSPEHAEYIENIFNAMKKGDLGSAARRLKTLHRVADADFDVLGVPKSKRNFMPKPMAAQIVNFLQTIGDDVSSTVFNDIASGLKYDDDTSLAPQFIEELRAQGLKPEFVQAMYVSNPAVQKELVDISVMDVKDIVVGMPSTIKSDVGSEMVDALEDYRTAYLAGGGFSSLPINGGNAANKIFNQQFDTIEKLALTRLKKGGSVAEAVESAINDLIPESSQTVIEQSGIYVVPMQFNPQIIQQNTSLLMNEEILAVLDLDVLDAKQYPDFVDKAVAIASLSSTGKFLNNSTGDGLSLHYDMNGAYLPAGFEVKFSELPGLVSELYSKIDSVSEFPELAAGFRREGLLQAGITVGEDAAVVDGEVVVDEAAGYAAEAQKFIDGSK